MNNIATNSITASSAFALASRITVDQERLRSNSRYVGNFLADAGLGVNDRVVVILPQGVQQVLTLLSLIDHCVAVPINPQIAAAELIECLETIKPSAVITDSAVAEKYGFENLQRVGLVYQLLHHDDMTLSPLLGSTPQCSPGHPSNAARGILLSTSGTTGRPKWVFLEKGQLQESAQRIAASLALGATDRYLCLLPCYHIHGISTVLASLLSEGKVLVIPGFDPEVFPRQVAEHDITWTSATPTHYRLLVRNQEYSKWKLPESLRLLRSASAPMDRTLTTDLEETFARPVVQAYGMTEAGPLIATNAVAPGKNRPGSVGRPTGVEVAIGRKSQHENVRIPDEIWIRGSSVSSQYWSSESDSEKGGSGWLNTGDIGYLDEDGFLFITGRKRDIINSGGEKLSPSVIESVLQDHPAVDHAAVFGAYHPSLGEAPHAAIVLTRAFSNTSHSNEFTEGLVEEVRQFCLFRMAAASVPHIIHVCDKIPLSRGLKIDRQRLSEHFARLSEKQRLENFTPHRSSTLIKQIRELWSSKLGVDDIRDDHNYFNLGGDSITSVQISSELMRLLDLELDADFCMQFPTVRLQARELEAKIAVSRVYRSEQQDCPKLGRLAPLSPGQRRLWLLDKLGASTQYNMCAAVSLHGQLQTDRLVAALELVVKKHGALRTSIRMLDSRPVQYIDPNWSPTLEMENIGPASEGEIESRLKAITSAERARVFTLGDEPPIRYRLLRLSDHRHVFLLSVHHVIFDGWSKGIFFRDLFDNYTNLETNSSPGEIEEMGFEEFCYSENERIDTVSHQESLGWWRSKLEQIPSSPPLFDRAQSESKLPDAGARLEFDISLELSGSIERCARERETSVYPLFLAALQLTIAQLTGKHVFCVGTAVANRSPGKHEDAIGFFANTLPMPARIDATMTLSDFISECTELASGAMHHCNVDFGDIVADSSANRGGDGAGLIQVMFAYQNYPTFGSTGGLLEAEFHDVDSDTAKFDLGLYLTPGLDRLGGVWQYRTGRFNSQEMRGLVDVFVRNLETIAAKSEVALGEIIGVDHSSSGTQSRAVAAPAVSLLERIALHAVNSPNSTAITGHSGSISYFQLQQRIEHAAITLHSQGIREGSRVGVLLPRGSQALIAALAIWRLGATYIPLDCSYPLPRMDYMCSNALVDLIIADNRTVHTVENLNGVSGGAYRTLVMEDSQPVVTSMLQCPSSDDTAAYIIYTSGSTGKPKGVLVTYRNIHHYLGTMQEELNIAADDVYLHSASFSFSSSIRQFALPLYAGATVCMASRSDVMNPERVLELVEREGLSIIDLVPTHWSNIVSWVKLAVNRHRRFDVSSLRCLLSASEPLKNRLREQMAECFPDAKLINMYGQTETSGIVAIDKNPQPAIGNILSIGKAIEGTDISLIDANGEQVGVGETGEIVISSPSVASGYAGESQQSSMAFYEFRGQRAYRTGDLATRDENGRLYYLGRADAQLKHRGFRIEPGDIESVALDYPSVTEAVATLTRAPGSEIDRLHLFFCADSEPGERARLITGLKKYLRSELPTHMVPGAVTRLDALPRTLSGKLDRSALPQECRVSGQAVRSGSIGLANQLTEIWQDVLGLDSVKGNDNFFDLGGNSIYSIEIVAQANERGISLSLEQLFQHQTVDKLATELCSSGEAGGACAVPQEVRGAGNEKDLPRYDIDSLRNYSMEALTKAGLMEEGARILTEVQLESSLRGQVTHNIGDIPRYAKRLSKGILNGQPEIRIEDTSPLSATVDGDNAPGQWVATLAMDKAIAMAEASGVGIVSVRRSNHYGAAGHYAWQASRSGVIGLCFTNGPVILAPTGGNTPLFGNNPLAVGIPRGEASPIVLDISMSVATRGKIGLTVAEGQPIEPGWILNKLGLPSTSLDDLAAGLAVPIGGHKGYGLAFIIEILAGALSGSGYCSDHAGRAAARHGGSDIGHLFVVINPELLMSSSRFEQRVNDIVDQTKLSSRATGVTDIYIPGELELNAREENLKRGIALHNSALQRLLDYRESNHLNSPIIEIQPAIKEAGI